MTTGPPDSAFLHCSMNTERERDMYLATAPCSQTPNCSTFRQHPNPDHADPPCRATALFPELGSFKGPKDHRTIGILVRHGFWNLFVLGLRARRWLADVSLYAFAEIPVSSAGAPLQAIRAVESGEVTTTSQRWAVPGAVCSPCHMAVSISWGSFLMH